MQVVVLSSTLDALLLVIQQWCDETGMALHPLKTEGMWIGRRRNDTAVWHPAMYDDTSTRGGAQAASATPPAQPRLAWVPPSGSLGVLGAKIGHGITEETKLKKAKLGPR
jgi:hypothetical protein